MTQPDPVFIVSAEVGGEYEIEEIGFADIDQARSYGASLDRETHGRFAIYSVSISTGVHFLEIGECDGKPIRTRKRRCYGDCNST